MFAVRASSLLALTIFPLLLHIVAAPPVARAQFETRGGFDVGQSYPYSVVVGDFDRDGTLDVAEVNYFPTGSVNVYLGDGDGTFRLGSTYAVGVFPWYGVTASFRKNGVLDLAISDKLSNGVWVMLGNGDGTFQPPVSYPTSAEPYMLALGGFMGSGNLDIVTVEGTSTPGCALQLRRGAARQWRRDVWRAYHHAGPI